MTEILAHGYTSGSTQQELSNEYQHDRVKMVFKDLCIFVLWTNVASALERVNTIIFTHGANTRPDNHISILKKEQRFRRDVRLEFFPAAKIALTVIHTFVK